MIDYKRAYTELMGEWFEEVTIALEDAAEDAGGDMEVGGPCGCFRCGSVFDADDFFDLAIRGDDVLCPNCKTPTLLGNGDGNGLEVAFGVGCLECYEAVEGDAAWDVVTSDDASDEHWRLSVLSSL